MADISHIQNGLKMTFRQQTALAAKLALPAILAQLSSILMQYIDAAMVGRLGAECAASVGLVSTSLWLFWGVSSVVATGFSVQVAHKIGAKDDEGARSILRQAITASLLFSLAVTAIGVAISDYLPAWLGGDRAIRADASIYFLTFVAALPVLTLSYLAGGMLRCAGNMKVPSMLNIGMCVLDVVFNFLLIFPTREITVFGAGFTVPGAGLGVFGAALGTILAEFVVASVMMYYLCAIEPSLRLKGYGRGSFKPTRPVITKGARIAGPMMLERAIFCGAQIMVTVIVAPLGNVAIAANAFGVTAESLCYMPCYGISDAATTLIGQSYGANRPGLVKRFAGITVGLGVCVMVVMGIVMYISAPLMMDILTNVPSIKTLGTEVLRIEAWAEPLYGASIVAYGVFVGMGDTLVPAIMNFSSIWLVRIPLAAILAPSMGLRGVWVAMAIELSFRGLIFLWRLLSRRWLPRNMRTTPA